MYVHYYNWWNGLKYKIETDCRNLSDYGEKYCAVNDCCWLIPGTWKEEE